MNASTSELKSSGNDNLWDNTVQSSLTAKQKELLSVLKQAIDNTDLDLNQTLDIFESVRSRANTECTGEERIVIIAAVEIGSNSLIYWNENIDEWVAVFSNENKSLKRWFNWKKLGEADVSGAVTGAISGAGAGVSALAGGLGASAGQAAKQIFNHIFN